MNVWRKLAGLQLWKRKSYIALAAIEILLLVWGIAGLFGKNHVYEYGWDNAVVNFGEYSEADGGYRADATLGSVGHMIDYQNIALPRGYYVVSVKYQTDVDYANMCNVTAVGAAFNSCLTNGSNFHAGLNETEFGMWLLEDAENLMMHITYNSGTLVVKGLTITETNALVRMGLFTLLCGILLLNSILLFREYDKNFGVERKTKIVLFGLGLITVFASLPLFTDYVLCSGDIGYHLLRAEGIKDGILSGQFPVRISPKWLENYGYASAVFYPETMLLPLGLLRILGFTITTSYRIFMFGVNFVTALAAYWCFCRMFQSEYVGLLCSMLHTFSIYRLFNTYTKGSLGETFAMIFLPLIVYGFYRVFTENPESKEYKWCNIPLTIGFCGLLQSHLLTCELVGGFTVLLCIVMWKKVFRKETFLVLAKTVIWTACISMWFLVPFLDYMMTGDFVIHNVSGRTIQERGLYLAHLLMGTPFAGGSTEFTDRGMIETAPVGIGFALLVMFLLWCFLYFVKGQKALEQEGLSRQELKFSVIAVWFAGLAMVMSLNIFPWDRIQSMNRVFATLISSLQFPTRVLTIANVLLVALAGLTGKYIIMAGKETWKTAFVCGICGLTIGTSLFTMSQHLFTGGFMRVYNIEGMAYGYIAGAEYLPYGTDQSQLRHKGPSAGENVLIEGYEKGALRVDVNCYHTGSEEGTLTLPLLYYKGYQAYDLDTGEVFEVFDGENHSVSVKVPGGYTGIIRTHFVSPWYWRAAELITLLSVAGYLFWIGKARRTAKSRKAEIV